MRKPRYSWSKGSIRSDDRQPIFLPCIFFRGVSLKVRRHLRAGSFSFWISSEQERDGNSYQAQSKRTGVKSARRMAWQEAIGAMRKVLNCLFRLQLEESNRIILFPNFLSACAKPAGDMHQCCNTLVFGDETRSDNHLPLGQFGFRRLEANRMMARLAYPSSCIVPCHHDRPIRNSLPPLILLPSFLSVRLPSFFIVDVLISSSATRFTPQT